MYVCCYYHNYVTPLKYLIFLGIVEKKKIIEKVNNSEKAWGSKERKGVSSDDDEQPPKKRGQPKKVVESRYHQPMKTESGDSHKLLEAMINEMKKEHPRKEIILPLMKNCFTERRDFVMNEALPLYAYRRSIQH